MEASTESPAFAEDNDGPRLEAVRRATKTWTGQLVDLTGRNNLLYYRDLKVGTLPLDSCPRQVLYSALAGRSVPSAWVRHRLRPCGAAKVTDS